MKTHTYEIKVEWTGNQSNGTLNYKSYSRNHIISGKEKYNEILASSDPSFLGDQSRYNPEDLFLSSLSACHMLWYLHLCSVNKIIVTSYIDKAEGIMEETTGGNGRFKQVILKPVVTITNQEQMEKAHTLHSEANTMCFIANSCNFKVEHRPKVIIG